MSIEEKLNVIKNAKFVRIKNELLSVYPLDDDRFDPNAFCNEIENVYHNNGAHAMEVLKYSILGIPTHLPTLYKDELIDNILSLDNFLKAKKRYYR